MDIDQSRMPPGPTRVEELAVQLDAVGGAEQHLLRRDEALGRRDRSQWRLASVEQDGMGRARHIGRDRRHRFAGERREEQHVAAAEPRRLAALQRTTEDMRVTVGVDRVEERVARAIQQEGLDLEGAAGERAGLSAARRIERVDVQPAATFPGKEDEVAPAPEEVAAARPVIAPARSGWGRPERARIAGL